MTRIGGTYARLIDELIRERTGIVAGHHQNDTEQRVFGRAMARAGVSDEAVYLALLQRDSKTFDELIADLTVPETYFFRDPPHYELLRREVLPAVLSKRAASETLEVWSAGCATGEEPYSLAMLLEQELLGERSQVLGSDISIRALARARRGVYGRWSLRATNEASVKRYFEQHGREYRLTPRIRKKVRLVQHSLSAEAYPRPGSRAFGFDLILCRNVLIYFDREATAKVGQKLARALKDDGWLMLGPSDPVLEIEEWCDKVATPCGLLYRRRHAREPVPQPRHWRSRTHHARSTPPVALRSEPPAPREEAPRAEPIPVEDPLPALARLLEAHGPTVAEAGCRELITLHPLNAALQLMHATLLYDLGKRDQAEAALRRALYLDRSLLVAQMLVATLVEQRGDHEAAARLYETLAREAEALPAEEPVPHGDGLTHAALAGVARQRVRALQRGPA
ncbi:MAG TPA: CheR family methyltransferase [Polyangiales bacterium]|nr:CheR family methyltransferase [Polyangiales bacterium]